MEKVTTVRYVITGPDGQFLYDLWHGQAHWTVAAQHPMQTGHAWLSFDNAIAKLKEAREALGRDDLNLSLMKLERRSGAWELISQQGVTA
jgi:hypothetical protein